jgi:GrpB-like predicted nucleotidyltransferase (UPF0157 family)
MSNVTIVAYRESWPAEFEAIRERLSVALGQVARQIEHIGSTAVPGLAAKDVIDVQVTVADLDVLVLVPTILAAGFVISANGPHGADHRPAGSHSTDPKDWDKLFFHAPSESRRVNIHVRVMGRANERYARLFRDYLRNHASEATTYSEFKQRLATLDIETAAYAQIKDPVCDLVMVAAELWAARVGWH